MPPGLERLSDRQRAYLLNNFGFLLEQKRRYQEALPCYERALALARGLGNRELEATVRNNFSQALMARGRYREALVHQQDALAIARDLDDELRQALFHFNLGVCHLLMGRHGSAHSHGLEARAIALRLENPELEQMSTALLAFAQLDVENLEGSRVLLTTALEDSRRLGVSTGRPMLLAMKALIDVLSGQAEAALPELEQALTQAREAASLETEAMVRYIRAAAYLSLRCPDEALREAEAAFEIFDDLHIDPGRAIGRIGLSLSRSSQDLGAGSGSFQGLEEAAAAFERILRNLDVEGFLAAFAASAPRDVYDVLIYLAARQDRAALAFGYAEKVRARAFLQQLGNPRIELAGAAPELGQARRRVQELQAELAERCSVRPPDTVCEESHQDLRTARRQHLELRDRIAARHPEVAAVLDIETVDLQQVRSGLLGEQTSMIAYYLAGPYVLAWVVDRQEEDPRVRILDLTTGDLESQVKYLLQTLRSRSFDPMAAEQLYRQLIAPLASDLRHQDLLIVPHGILHYLPFAALRNEKTKRYLIEDYSLTFAPSASVLPYLARRSSPFQGRLLVLGDSDGSLPRAADEARSIARLAGARPLLGAEATEAALRARVGNSDLLHLAIHGYYKPQDPMYSYLQLAAGGGHDGRLEVYEVFDLDLQGTNLVVLSACDTVFGEHSRGDEIVGLTRAFLDAGSPAVVTSLWRIEDGASKELMERFYGVLGLGGSLAEALRQAQRAMLSQEAWRSPHSWAGFALTGDARGFCEPAGCW